MQLALDLPIPAVPERRTALKVAKRRGDQAIAAGAEKAKRIDPVFLERACAHVLAYLGQHDTSSGGKLVDWIRVTDEPKACESAYGLCE
mgnify:CR=1 FL=1